MTSLVSDAWSGDGNAWSGDGDEILGFTQGVSPAIEITPTDVEARSGNASAGLGAEGLRHPFDMDRSSRAPYV